MRWWNGEARERFWLEATDRSDIGIDLRAPYANVSGSDEWRYTLFREAEPGDVVFHYDTRAGAITTISRVSGREQPNPIVWAARGTYARERGAEPTELPGYIVPLSDARQLEVQVTLADIRALQDKLGRLVEELTARHRAPLYFPFAGRPLRLNQGYAFKLPADFVAAFDSLAAAAAGGVLASETQDSEPQSAVRRAVALMEDAAEAYEISGLQQLRRDLRGFHRLPGRRIFSERTTTDEWAFHNGGRSELQFNIGLDEFPDGSEALRVGVAFSLEPSQSLPDWRVLVPRIRRFSEYLRERPESFGDLAMWHWVHSVRSLDRKPAPIDPGIVEEGAFIFLGTRQRPDSFDAAAALSTFDRLLDLYQHVQTGPALLDAQGPTVATPEGGSLSLTGGVGSKTTGTLTATYPERTLNITLRHNEIQNRLLEQLTKGGLKAILEARLGQRAIDVVVEREGGSWFYEVKTASTARQCIREALGQLLDYALWPGAPRPARLIVVGEELPDEEVARYLEALNAQFPIPLDYLQVTLD